RVHPPCYESCQWRPRDFCIYVSAPARNERKTCGSSPVRRESLRIRSGTLQTIGPLGGEGGDERAKKDPHVFRGRTPGPLRCRFLRTFASLFSPARQELNGSSPLDPLLRPRRPSLQSRADCLGTPSLI